MFHFIGNSLKSAESVIDFNRS